MTDERDRDEPGEEDPPSQDDPPTDRNPPIPPGPVYSLEEMKQIARLVPEHVVTNRNFELISDIFSRDVVQHGPFRDELQGQEAVKDQLSAIIDAFPDLEVIVEDIIAEERMVAMRVTLHGTHKGVFMGIEPTGTQFEVENMVFTRIEDGKIKERWVQVDTFDMLHQLGVLEQA